VLTISAPVKRVEGHVNRPLPGKSHAPHRHCTATRHLFVLPAIAKMADPSPLTTQISSNNFSSRPNLVYTVPMNYAIRFSEPVTPLTARRVWYGVGACLICQSDPRSGMKMSSSPAALHGRLFLEEAVALTLGRANSN
jgi:hypothetical protein